MLAANPHRGVPRRSPPNVFSVKCGLSGFSPAGETQTTDGFWVPQELTSWVPSTERLGVLSP
jgi:hypothetical protein